MLPTNGAVFCSYADGWKCEPEYEFGNEEKAKIYQAIEKALAQAGLEKSGTLYGERIEDRGQQITFSALGSEAPLEEKERWDPDYAKRLKLKAIIEKDLPDFAVHIGGTTSLDITRKGIDKAYGIRRISEKLGLKFEEILYVADDMEKGSNNATIEGLGVACRQVDNPAEAAKLISDIIGQVD
ncbi:MAG: HAD hydrolase family protein [bacterium]|nr:HAD hydrolase family protein [bacterium]